MYKTSYSSNLNWHFYTNTVENGYMYGNFDNIKNQIYLYVKSDTDVKDCIPEIFHDYIYSISDENLALEVLGTKGKQKYYKELENLGFKDYCLYTICVTPTFINEVTDLVLKGE